MYNIDLKNIRSTYLPASIFSIAGLIMFAIFLIIPLFIINSKNNYDSSTNAVDIEYETYTDDDGDTMYSPTYYFEVDGIEYTCVSNSASNKKSANKDDIIYYNKNNPTDCLTQNELDSAKIMIYISAIPLIFSAVGLTSILKTRKKVKKVKSLVQNGTLIKNLPYTMVDSNKLVNGVKLQSIAVDYTFPDGTRKKLISNPRYDNKIGDADKLVDLLIDSTDPDNYYIDFNIEQKQ